MNVLLAVSHLDSFVQLLGVLIIFLFVLVITYYTTKWMGGYQKARMNNKNLKIIETIGVGNNKTISIVEAGTTYLVISVGKDEVHLLSQLSREQLKDLSFENEAAEFSQESFQEIMAKIKDKIPKKRE